MPAEQPPLKVERAIAGLKSFQDDDLSILSVVACGQQAVPALRAMLFEREPSGLYQPRCRAVEALAALGAYEILIEFLQADRTITDPIERLGEDAVINAAALAVADVREERVLQLLLRLAQRPALTGVIGAVGAFGKTEAIPVLIDALAEDASRLTAENALRKLRQRARSALLKTASERAPAGKRESESNTRQRLSALKLLGELGIPRSVWPSLRSLMHDADAKIAVLACQIGLKCAPPGERPKAASYLIRLLAHEDWLLRQDVESCLLAHFNDARLAIHAYLNGAPLPGEDPAARTQIGIILRRVIDSAQAATPR